MPQSTLVLNVNILHCVIYFTRVITNYLNLNFRNIDGGKLQRSGDTDEQRFVKSTDGHYTRFCSMSAVFRQYGYQLNGIKRLKIYSQKTHHHREYWLTRGKYWWTGRGGGRNSPISPTQFYSSGVGVHFPIELPENFLSMDWVRHCKFNLKQNDMHFFRRT